jgi:cysteinyl-tRNA synthetase
MGIRIQNTLTGKKEEFIPRDPGKAAMYVCGPTVYNYIHVGNARCYLTFDMVRRYLRYRGFEVLYAQNFTDVDDKIINAAAAEGVTAEALSEKYIEAFLEDMEALGVEPPDIAPKATGHIEEMLEMIESLIEKGIAYEVDGDVYYSVNSFTGYGKLSHRSLDDMKAGARVGVDERKRDPMDFALWKAAKPGEPAWDSPWGKGRPGWHIECSAMSHKYLGFGFDIHGGGLDLIFPHHENEIAQAEGSTGEAPFVRYWMHNGFVTMSGEKMAKSVGNVIRVRDALAEADAMAIRTLFLGTHYRSPIDFNADKLTEAGKAYQRLNTVIGAIDRVVADYREPVKVIIGSGKEDVLAQEARQAQSDFETAMDDDFNAPDALGSLFTLARRTNSFIKDRSVFSLDELDVLADVKEKMEKMGGALGLLFSGFSDDADDVLKDKIERLIEQRGKAKADKDWQTADALRGELQGMGVVLEDTPDGTKWRRIKRHS